MVLSEAEIPGATKPLIRLNWLNVAPLPNPALNAEFPAAVWEKTFPACPGAKSPATTNEFTIGGLEEKLSTSTAGKESEKIPIPPRKTVLLFPNGLKVKPRRGCHTMLSVAG